jgi:integrase
VAGRNANGEGTVYRRKDGRWEAAGYFLTASGQRKRVRKLGRTREEAYDKLIEVKGQSRQGIPVPDRSWKVGEFLDYWLETTILPRRRLTTYERHETIVRLHLKPGLGKYSLAQLSVANTQRYFDTKLAEGVSVATLDNMRKTLRAALTSAQRLEVVFRNVASLIQSAGYDPSEADWWTVEEVERFLEAIKSDRYCAAFILVALYAFRRGEVLGLQWRDVDFEASALRIRRQLQRVGHKLQLQDVKTKASRRDEPLLQTARAVLAQHREQQCKLRELAGNAWKGSGTDDELIFTTRTGAPVDPRNLTRSFERICRTNGLRKIKLHEVRHTNATLQLNLEVASRTTQAILGHSTDSITKQIYQHSDLKNKQDALEKVERLFWRGASSPRCRQLLPSSRQIVDQITSFISGSGEWTRTTDPRLMRTINASLRERLTGVKGFIEARRNAWLLGLVAVSVAVKVDPPAGP